MPPPEKRYMHGLYIIVRQVMRLAKRLLKTKGRRRGPKKYPIAARIAVLAWVILHGHSYRRALDDLHNLGVYRRLGLKTCPSLASITRWKRTLVNEVDLLIRLSFYKIARMRRRAKKLLALVDGTGFTISRASNNYLKRIGRRRYYVLLTAIYYPEIDAFFAIAVTPDSVSEITAMRELLLDRVIQAGIFWGLIGDKRYDSEDIISRLEKHGITSMIPARQGKLKPKGGPRARASEQYERFVAANGHVRSLIESAFSSLKSLACDRIRSSSWQSRTCDVYVLVLAYNVITILSFERRL